MKYRYPFPPETVTRGIRWLEVQVGDGGAYLFQYEDIDKPCKWDGFYESVEDALAGCEETWGIRRSEWQVIA